MKLIKFPECNVVFAENQPEYLQLPALKMADGEVICCWQLTWKERLQLLVRGKVWHSILTFNHPLQPQLLTVDPPFQVEARR